MTRAVHRLDLVVQTKGKEGATLSNAAILRRAFDLDAAGLEGVAWTHPENQDPWFPPELGPRDSASEPSAVPKARALRLAPSRRVRSAATRSPSSAKDAGPVLAERLLQPRDAITARGRILHRLLQEVEWLDTFRGTDDELLAIARQVDPDPELVAASVAEFRAALRSPGLRSVLERPNGEVSAWRERPFSLFLPDEDGAEILWSGAFDRVVIRSQDGKPVSADLVDFKTDRVEGEALASRVESYRPQMRAYQRALSGITGLKESAIQLRLVFVTPDVVRDL
jgi:ATP-dependent exoDNAse (exonuclease V) beta subunit